MTTREQIYAALFTLVSTGEGSSGTLAWGSNQAFVYTSRRVKLWDDLPSQPALCQAEQGETVTQATGFPPKRTFRASWLIYHKAGASPSAVPTTANNEILDAVEALFVPTPADPGFPDKRLTLGGLVHHCWIDGRIIKDPGDLDGQALMVVPISILVP